MIILFWIIALTVAIVATLTLQIAAALFWWAVVVGGYIWYQGGWGRTLCRFGHHKWDMYAGYYKERIHSQAVCERCKMTGKEYLETH